MAVMSPACSGARCRGSVRASTSICSGLRCRGSVRASTSLAAVATGGSSGGAGSAPPPTAVITGCSSGIGRASALLLADNGWRVWAGARSDADLQELGRLHERISPLRVDVASQQSIAAAAEVVDADAAAGGHGVQLLVNNAGIGMLAPIEYFPMDKFREVMEVNLLGVLAVSQAFVPLLRRGKGRIINMGSVAGHMGLPLWSAYCASKHALEGLSECMRYELAPQGVDVVLFKPGPVATPIWGASRARSLAVEPGVLDRARRAYSEAYDAMDGITQEAEATAVPVDEVARLVLHVATTTQRPRLRYLIGSNAGTMWRLKRLLPDAAWEAAMGAVLSRAAAATRQAGGGGGKR